MDQLDGLINSLSVPLVKKSEVSKVIYDNQNIFRTNDKDLIYNSSTKYLNIFLNDYTQSENFKEMILKKFPNLQIETWQTKNTLLLVVMQIEKYFVFFVLFIIVIIATFNLFASLSMTIFEKSQDIGILRTMGVSGKRIKRIFILQGMISGVVGLILGIIIGVAVVVTQIKYEWININISNGLSHPLPVELNIYNLIFITLFTLIVVFLSSYYPAKFSTENSIADSIKLNF